MAFVLTVVSTVDYNDKRAVTCHGVFDSSYPYGGEAPASGFLTELGLATVDSVLCGTSGSYTFAYDFTYNKLKAYAAPIAPMYSIAEAHTLDSSLNFTSTYPVGYILSMKTPVEAIELVLPTATPAAGQGHPTTNFVTGTASTFLLNPTNAVTNGEFTTNLTGWTDSGSKWSIVSGQAHKATGAATLTWDGLTPANGQNYVVTFTLTCTNGGAEGITVSLGGDTGTARIPADTAVHTYSEVLHCTGTNKLVFTTANATDVLNIDNVIVQRADVTMTYITQTPRLTGSVGSIGALNYAAYYLWETPSTATVEVDDTTDLSSVTALDLLFTGDPAA